MLSPNQTINIPYGIGSTEPLQCPVCGALSALFIRCETCGCMADCVERYLKSVSAVDGITRVFESPVAECLHCRVERANTSEGPHDCGEHAGWPQRPVTSRGVHGEGSE